jgi:tetratricopeptide (TPR) repeat protein
VPVEPADLERRTDLIGQEVFVDDHVAYLVPRGEDEPDELHLKRTSVPFLIQKGRRIPSTGRMKAAIVRGVLKRQGDRLVCEVSELQPVALDNERLEQGLANLPRRDYETRKAWARWAERRARDFKDDALLKRAKNLEAEALLLETKMARLGVDAPKEWLAKAHDARRRRLPEPGPSELAHRALRAMLSAATSLAEVGKVIQEIEGFFPDAASDRAAGRLNLAAWEARYNADPENAYHEAPEALRKALDRRLWADANERLLELQASGDIQAALTAAQRAQTILPEKPDFGSQLLKSAVERGRANLKSLLLDDARALAEVYRKQLGQPAEALVVLRDWLNIQRGKLSTTDAEGPLGLANLYEELLEDRVTAVELLRKAWKIDPSSKEIAEAFRTRGFRKVKDDWIEGTRGDAGNPAAASVGRNRPETGKSRGLRGMTSDEVRAQLGQPARVSYIAAKGQLIEQWNFPVDTKRDLYVNLLHAPGELKPRVIADYTLPRRSPKGEIGSAR